MNAIIVDHPIGSLLLLSLILAAAIMWTARDLRGKL